MIFTIIKEVKMSSQKNSTLELIKLFASYMVVFIHVPFYGKFGDAIDAIACIDYLENHFFFCLDSKRKKNRIATAHNAPKLFAYTSSKSP